MNISHIPSNIIMAANRYMVLLSKMELDYEAVTATGQQPLYHKQHRQQRHPLA